MPTYAEQCSALLAEVADGMIQSPFQCTSNLRSILHDRRSTVDSQLSLSLSEINNGYGELAIMQDDIGMAVNI